MQGAARKPDQEAAKPAVERISRPTLPAPRSNGLPGPIPSQGDFLDPRWRPINHGAVSESISFQRPGWVTLRDWDAFRKAVARRSTYSVSYSVRGTYQSLRQYLRHLRTERDERRNSQWWLCELEELDVLDAQSREIRARIKRAALARQAAPDVDESLQWVDVHEIVFPAGSVSYGLRNMVEAGRLAGLSFDADRNVVRTTRALRYREASE